MYVLYSLLTLVAFVAVSSSPARLAARAAVSEPSVPTTYVFTRNPPESSAERRL